MIKKCYCLEINFRQFLSLNWFFLYFKSAFSETNLHNTICFSATIYLVELNKLIVNHLRILNDDVTPKMWKSVMV